MAIDVFISVGITNKPEQEAFIQAVEQFLRDNELNPRCVGRTDFSSVQPLKFIEQIMSQCSGTVVIALERIHIQNGLEKRGSDAEKVLSNVNISTVWNQIEAGMAYLLGHPLLVIVERGLRKEGLLEPGYDWYIQSVDIDTSTLHSREFAGVFADWKRRVEDFHTNKDKKKINSQAAIEPEKLTVGQIFGALKPAQLWAIVGTLMGALTAVAVSAYKLGTLSSSPAKTSSSYEIETSVKIIASSESSITNPLQRTFKSRRVSDHLPP